MCAAIAETANQTGRNYVVRRAQAATTAEHMKPAQGAGQKQYVTIPCRVSEGMFSTEWAVEVDTADGQVGSLFVHKSLVSDLDRGMGRLRVRWIRDEGVELVTVLLPQQSPQIGLWLQVRNEQVV